ncbi:hypothetical protein PAHAL_5G098000 [Panicum hallii]|uniref:Uncharacterized protein n=1 Tax=Panicum hallii TaxID=206008 RepID=A0A2T8IJG9_9POAL|nr:hypothetical protein PAHAL_5G098000 [Panicum hallii]
MLQLSIMLFSVPLYLYLLSTCDVSGGGAGKGAVRWRVPVTSRFCSDRTDHAARTGKALLLEAGLETTYELLDVSWDLARGDHSLDLRSYG